METIELNGKRWNVHCVTGKLIARKFESSTSAPTIVRGQIGTMSIVPAITTSSLNFEVFTLSGEYKRFSHMRPEKYDFRKTVIGNVLSNISFSYSGKKFDRVEWVAIIDHTIDKVYYQPFLKNTYKLRAVKYLIIVLTVIIPMLVVAGFFIDQFLGEENQFQHAHNELTHASDYFRYSISVYLVLVIYYFGVKFYNKIKISSLVNRLRKEVDLNKYESNDLNNNSQPIPKAQSSLHLQDLATPGNSIKAGQQDDSEKFTEKLTTLKSMFEKGLILQEEYDKKRGEILGKL